MENKSVKIAFDPFAKFEPGAPIRLMPQGKWYRGERTLDLTPQVLQEIESNFEQGLPRYRVGINLNHEDDKGKVGDIRKIAYMPDGPNGAGIYATDYEFTEKGLKAIEEDGYDGVSAEMVWSINSGARFQDPETGSEFDNVLVGVALTPHPFFGHEHVALYSNKPEVHMEDSFYDRLINGIKELLTKKEVLTEEIMSEPEVIEDIQEVIMTEVLTVETPEAIDPEKFVSRDEYEKLATEANDAKERFEKLEAELNTEKLARQQERLELEVDSFKALAFEKEEYVERMTKVEATDPELADWLRSKWGTIDEAMHESGLMEEIGSSREAETESLDSVATRIVNEKFGGDFNHYSDALSEVARTRPELAKVYRG